MVGILRALQLAALTFLAAGASHAAAGIPPADRGGGESRRRREYARTGDHPLRLAGNVCAPVMCPSTTLVLGTGIGIYTTRVTLTGTNQLTPGGSGRVTLVMPTRVDSLLTGALPLFATQTLVLVPEPGTLALLAAAAAALAARGRRLQHSRAASRGGGTAVGTLIAVLLAADASHAGRERET